MIVTEHSMRIARGSSEGQQSISLSTTSAQSAIIGAERVLVYSDVACFLVANANPTATVASGTPIPAGVLLRVTGLQATDKIAGITATGTGTLQIRPEA